MNKLYYSSFALLVSSQVMAQPSKAEAEKLAPLKADFLTYIAQMEKVDQQWLDPIAVDNLTSETMSSSNKKQHSNDMAKSVEHSQNKKPDTLSEQPPMNDKGVQ